MASQSRLAKARRSTPPCVDTRGVRRAFPGDVTRVELVVGGIEVFGVEHRAGEDAAPLIDLAVPDDLELGIATQPVPAAPPEPVQHEPVTASSEHVTLDAPVFVEHGTSAFQVRFEGQVAAAGGTPVELHEFGRVHRRVRLPVPPRPGVGERLHGPGRLVPEPWSCTELVVSRPRLIELVEVVEVEAERTPVFGVVVHEHELDLEVRGVRSGDGHHVQSPTVFDREDVLPTEASVGRELRQRSSCRQVLVAVERAPAERPVIEDLRRRQHQVGERRPISRRGTLPMNRWLASICVACGAPSPAM